MKKITLEDLLRSDIAKRHNFTEQYTPSDLITKKLMALITNLLDPLYYAISKEYPTAELTSTSGYRCKRVNYTAGGTDNSQHMAGEASDIEMRIDDKEANILLAQLILKNNIVFDQMILEYGTLQKPEWIHLSWDLDKKIQRNYILRIGYNAAGEFKTFAMSKKEVLAIK